MELEQQHGDDRVVQAAVAWASDTLLDLGRAIPVDEEQQESAALMRLQALSFTTSSVQVAASCDPISQLTPLLGDDGRLETMEPEAAAEVLDLCSTSIASDDEFLDATETLLSKVACVPLGDAFTRRMLNLSTQIDTQDSSGSDAMLLDLMPIEIKIRVWGNHLPSWTCQIERWFLAAHREPFHSIGSILAFNAPGNRKQDRAQIMGVSDWVKAFQNFSHLYVALILWLQDHFEVLGSCRSVELAGTLAVLTRPSDPVGMFDRSLVNNLWSANPSFWTATVRIQRFVVIGKNVERLSRTELTQATAVSEWVGVAERPHLILEAIEMLFDPQQAREEQSSTRAFSEDTAGKGVSGAVRLLGWFYANVSSFPPSEEISAIARSLRSNLAGVDLETGARWIQLHRGDFASTTTLRLRLVWFWLLQSVHSAESPLGDRREEGEEEEDTPNAAAVTSVLESVEYVFRKFTPPEHKRCMLWLAGRQFEVMLTMLRA